MGKKRVKPTDKIEYDDVTITYKNKNGDTVFISRATFSTVFRTDIKKLKEQGEKIFDEITKVAFPISSVYLIPEKKKGK